MTENVVWHEGAVSPAERSALTGGAGVTVWITGLSGSGKSTVAYAAERMLVERGRVAFVLDGDNLRHGLNRDLAFSAEDRSENVRRIGEVARLMADAGLVVLVPVISPYRTDREAVRLLHEAAGVPFVEVFADAPLAVCKDRDPKGLYERALKGEIKGFTGVDDPYEEPGPETLRVDTSVLSVQDAASVVVGRIEELDTPEGA